MIIAKNPVPCTEGVPAMKHDTNQLIKIRRDNRSGKSSHLVCMFSRPLSAHLCTCKFPYSTFLARDCSVCYLRTLIKTESRSKVSIVMHYPGRTGRGRVG